MRCPFKANSLHHCPLTPCGFCDGRLQEPPLCTPPHSCLPAPPPCALQPPCWVGQSQSAPSLGGQPQSESVSVPVAVHQPSHWLATLLSLYSRMGTNDMVHHKQSAPLYYVTTPAAALATHMLAGVCMYKCSVQPLQATRKMKHACPSTHGVIQNCWTSPSNVQAMQCSAGGHCCCKAHPARLRRCGTVQQSQRQQAARLTATNFLNKPRPWPGGTDEVQACANRHCCAQQQTVHKTSITRVHANTALSTNAVQDPDSSQTTDCLSASNAHTHTHTRICGWHVSCVQPIMRVACPAYSP